VLAILKAGGAYVPLDPSILKEASGFHAGRFGAMRSSRKDRQDALEGARKTRHVVVSTWIVPIHGEATSHQSVHGCGPTNLAYVIYTSGSSGRPKALLSNSKVCEPDYMASASYQVTPQDRATLLAAGFRRAVGTLAVPGSRGERHVPHERHDCPEAVLPAWGGGNHVDVSARLRWAERCCWRIAAENKKLRRADCENGCIAPSAGLAGHDQSLRSDRVQRGGGPPAR